MLLEGVVGLSIITLIAVFVAMFVLECMHLPQTSDYEWELRHGTRPLEPEELVKQYNDNMRAQIEAHYE